MTNATTIITDPCIAQSLSDIQPAIEHLNIMEDSLLAQLTHLSTVPLSTPSAFLTDKSPEVALLIGQSAQFLNLVSDYDSLISNLGTELKSFDVELGHLDQAIDRIDLLSDIQTCAQNVQAAMDLGDWETVAGYVERHLSRIQHTESSSGRLCITDFQDLPPQLQVLFPHYSAIESDLLKAESVIATNRSNLKHAITQAFAQATHDFSNPNSEQIRRCIALFPRIGEHEHGVTLFTKYIACMVADKCANVASDLHVLDASVNIQLITKLFDNIAMLVKQNTPMINDKYGSGHAIRLIQGLHYEGAKQALQLLTGWMDKRRFNQLLGMVKQGADVSAQELDTCIIEIVTILNRSDIYHRYVRAAGTDEMQRARSAGTPVLTNIVHQIDQDASVSGDCGIPHLSPFELAMKELSNHYISLELAYMRTNVDHAKSMDQLASPELQPLLTSSVDDIFYLLKKCVCRGLSTYDLTIVCTLLQEFESIVQLEFVGALFVNLDVVFDAFKSEPRQETRTPLMIQLNNLQQVVEYMPKFLETVDQNMQPLINLSTSTKETSTSVTAKRKEKVVFSLGPYNRLAHHVSQVLNQHLRAMFETFLQSKVYSLMKNYLYTNYVMDETEYMQMSTSNAYIGFNYKFTSAFSGLLANSKNELLHANLQVLLSIMVEYWIREWEKLVFSQRFSHFGALYLDRDLQTFASYMTNEAAGHSGIINGGGGDHDGPGTASLSWTHKLREKLVLMQQMITVLTITDLNEIYDYWGPEAIVSMDWKLTGSQVKQLLESRIEFSGADVAAIVV